MTQYQEISLGGADGLYYYGARWYDTLLGRWIQPDSIVPLVNQGVQAWDRFAYVNNSPVGFTDPTGHDRDCGMRDPGCKNTIPQNLKSKSADVLGGNIKDNRSKDRDPLRNDLEKQFNNIGSEYLTNGQKFGKVVTTALVETTIVIPTEIAFFVISAVAVSKGGPIGVIVDLALLPGEIAVADFGLSLAINTYESVKSGKNEDFKWVIIPALVSELPKPWQEQIYNLIPGLFQ